MNSFSGQESSSSFTSLFGNDTSSLLSPGVIGNARRVSDIAKKEN